MRARNNGGKLVSERLLTVEEEPALKENPEVAEWCEEGQTIKGEIMAAMHGEADPALLPEFRDWLAKSRKIERYINRTYADLGKWSLEQGLTPEEAAEAVRRGEYPPSAHRRGIAEDD